MLKHNIQYKHGLSSHPIHKAWSAMKGRCYNEKDASYNNYGGRGIYVCEEWVDNFMSFYDWAINNGWKKGLSLDRAENDSIYCPANCRWTTQLIQNRNMRTNIRFVAYNESKCLNEWAMDDRCQVSVSTLRKRLIEGWSVTDALSHKIEFKKARRFTKDGVYRKGIRLIEYKHQIKSVSEWGEIFGLKCKIITWRIDSGWNVNKALETPLNRETVKVPKDINSGKFIKVN